MIVGIFLTVLAGICILLFFFNRRFSNYKNLPPGPLSFPFIGSAYALGKEPHKDIKKLKKKYGNIISIDFGSYRGIVVNDYDTIKKILSLPEVQNRPNFEATYSVRGEIRTGIIWSSGKTNEEQRAFIMKALKIFGVGKKRMEILIQEQLAKLFDVFDNQSGKVIVNKELFNSAAIGALWTIISGESCKENDEKFKAILHTTKRMIAGCNNFVCFFPWLAQLFPNASGWNMWVDSIRQQNVYLTKTIQAHTEFFKGEDEEPNDIIEALLQKHKATQDPSSTFYGEQGDINILSTVGDLLQSGTETVSTYLTWVLSILIRYPDIQTKMQEEIDKNIGPNRLPELSDRQQMPYIEAVIYEILRYSAFTPVAAPHETSADLEINGFFIPKNTVVIPNIYDALWDPEHFDEPEVFRPERFINSDGSGLSRNLVTKVDLIFGHGKRICIGEAIVKDEAFLFMTGLCQRYTFKPDPNSYYEQEIKGNFGLTMVPVPHNLIIYKR